MSPGPRPDGRGSLRPTPPAVIAGWAVVGLAGGWVFRLASEHWGTPPVISWSQPLALLLVAAILGYTAWSTWRTVHVQHQRLDPGQGVNRLVLARACAVAGALFGGGYLGYGLTWLGDDAELADQRFWRCVIAALAGVLIVVAALLLERACRVRSDDPDLPGHA